MTQTVTEEDGTIHNFPDEATPGMIAQALGVAHEGGVEQAGAGGYDMGEARRLALKQGLAFNAVDELSGIVGGIKALAPGGQSPSEAYISERDKVRTLEKQYGEEHPFEQFGFEVAGSVPTLFIPGLGAFKMMQNANTLGKIAKNVGKVAAGGAALGGTYSLGAAEGTPKEQAIETAKGAGLGAGLSLIAPAAVGAIKGGKIVTRAIKEPVINEGLLDTAELALKYKIPLSLDEISSSRPLKNIQKISQEAPLSGQAAFREEQMSAWNRSLLKTIGIEGDKFTPKAMNEAFDRAGLEFDKLGAGKTFNLNDIFRPRTNEILVEAEQTATKDAIKNFNNRVKKILSNADNAGNIPGEKIALLRAETNKLARKTNNPDTQGLLHDLENAIIDTMTAGDDAASGAFSAAKQRYKNLIVLEPLATKAKGGNFSPSLLQQRVARIYGRQFTRGKAGEIGELARIGHELLPELGGSDTTQKSGYLLGLGGMMAAPLTTTSLLGVNRLYQETVNRNQSFVRKAISRKSKFTDTVTGKKP